MKLRTKLILLLTGFAFIPIFIFGVYLGITDLNRQLGLEEIELVTEGSEAADQVNLYISDAVGDMGFLSQSSQGKRLLSAFDEEDYDNIELESSLLSEMWETFFVNRQSFQMIQVIKDSGEPYLQVNRVAGQIKTAEGS